MSTNRIDGLLRIFREIPFATIKILKSKASNRDHLKKMDFQWPNFKNKLLEKQMEILIPKIQLG